MITVTITSDDLIEHGACKEGIDLFNTLYPSGIASIEWSAENQVKLITEVDPGREFIRWLVKEGLLPMWYLRRANLRNANLRNANLRNVVLYNADLRYADLRYADLRYADLRNANLCNASLINANLCNANLSGANLSGADCRGTNFTGANRLDIITDEFTKGLPS